MLTSNKPLLSKRGFEDKTSLLPYLAASLTCEDREMENKQDIIWFCNHCDLRVRYLYSNHWYWGRRIDSGNGRELMFEFIQHWLDAYIKMGPEKYKERYPNTSFEESK